MDTKRIIIFKLLEEYGEFDELFSKEKYQWTGTTSLGAYFILNTSSHYDWGLKTIKPAIKPTIKYR